MAFEGFGLGIKSRMRSLMHKAKRGLTLYHRWLGLRAAHIDRLPISSDSHLSFSQPFSARDERRISAIISSCSLNTHTPLSQFSRELQRMQSGISDIDMHRYTLASYPF
jgi:hypothetical protein